MSEILQPDISCKTAQEFLSLILPSGEFLGGKIENPTWLFRGQGRDHELIPSIFRKDEAAIKKFKKFTILLGNKRELILNATNYTKENIFIQGMYLNNRKYKSYSITQKVLMEGGILNFELSSFPNKME